MSANQAIAVMLALCILAAISLTACIGVVAWQARQEAVRVFTDMQGKRDGR